MVKALKVIFVKGPEKQPVLNNTSGHAFHVEEEIYIWELPYWKVLEVRSAINVMHLTKNLYGDLLGFLGLYEKTKDI
jgi:hypothetical protein